MDFISTTELDEIISHLRQLDTPSTTSVDLFSSLNEQHLEKLINAITLSSTLQTSLGSDPTNICVTITNLLTTISSSLSSSSEPSPSPSPSPSTPPPNSLILLIKLVNKLCRRELMKSTSNYENISLLSELGVCEILIQIFKCYKDSERLIEAVCWCIMVLASDNEDNQIKFANEGGCDLVLESLNNYAGNLEIIEIICRALRNLSSNLSIAAYCIAQGVGDPITGTIVIQSSNPVQLEAALWVVVNLACQTENATVLGSSGICVAVTDALRVNLSNEGVVTAACWAIRNLSCGSGFNYVQFSHTDVCNSLVQILSMYSTISTEELSFPPCVIPALWAISNLTCDNEISEQYGKIDNSCSILVTIFRNYYLQLSGILRLPELQHLVTNYLDALEAALWALRNAATGGINCHTQLVSEGLVDLITSFLQSEWIADLSPSHLSIACGVILNLLSVEYDTLILAPLLAPGMPLPTVIQIGNIPLCELLCDLMKKFPERGDLQEINCRSLRLLTRIHQNQDLHQQLFSFYHTAGVCRLAALALKNHPLYTDLTRNACELLFLLHYENNSEDLQFIEKIAEEIDEINLQKALLEPSEGVSSSSSPESNKKGAVDPNSKRVVIRPHDEMIRIWTSETLCERLGWN